MVLTQQQLQKIETGAIVYDNAGTKLGTIDFVKYGDEDFTKPGPETRAVNPGDVNTHETLMHEIVKAFTDADNTPEEIREYLLRTGYIRISRGTFQSKGYVSMDKVKKIEENSVTLVIPAKEMITLP